MKKSAKLTRVWLGGGLGNQLFQLAFAQNLYSKFQKPVILDYTFSLPRTNRSNEPEITSFVIPEGIYISRSNAYFWQKKIFNYCLRKNLALPKMSNPLIPRLFLKLLAYLVGGLRTKIVFSSDLGFHGFKYKPKINFYVGYFQSYKYSDAVSQANLKLNLASFEEAAIMKDFRQEALITKPLILHVRLTDYTENPNFGHLDSDYYRKALDWHQTNSEFENIWVFSDDINGAVEFLNIEFDKPVKWFDSSDYSSALTLSIMSLGWGYIIPNSTFSWWAAFIREKRDAEVVAPKRWFLDGNEPRHLIPKDWKRL